MTLEERQMKTLKTKKKRQELLDEADRIFWQVRKEVGASLKGNIKAFQAVDMHFTRLSKKDPSNKSLYHSVYFDFRRKLREEGDNMMKGGNDGINEES